MGYGWVRMRWSFVLMSLCLMLAGCAKETTNVQTANATSSPIDSGGPAVGEVYVELAPDGVELQGVTLYGGSEGHSERWLGGKSVAGGGVLPVPYVQGWWFDLIRPDGTYEGCALFGWDSVGGKGFVMCNSWQNIDLRFVVPTGATHEFEHRPTQGVPLSTWAINGDADD